MAESLKAWKKDETEIFIIYLEITELLILYLRLRLHMLSCCIMYVYKFRLELTVYLSLAFCKVPYLPCKDKW